MLFAMIYVQFVSILTLSLSRMIRKILIICAALTTLLFWGVVFAQTWNIDVMELPALTEYVTDFAGVLDDATLAELNENAYAHEQMSWHQFVAVLIPDRQWYELFDISLNIFNENQIGSAEKNDWLLLVIATNEKKIRIMVWYWLEGEMPDVLASKIIEEDIRPLVNSWDYAGAVKIFYARAQQVISSGEWKKIADEQEKEAAWEWMLFAVAVFAYFFGRTLRWSKKDKKSKKKSSWLFSGWLSVLVLVVSLVAIWTLVPLIVYLGAAFFGYIAWTSFMFFPGWPWWWFSWGSGWSWWGGGGSFGWFSWGGWSSGGWGAGD